MKRDRWRFVPMAGWIRSYERRWLKGDLIAGMAVAALIVPKNLGYAGIAGIPLQNGLYAAAAGAILYAVFGTSRQISTGPSSGLAAVAASAVAVAGVTGVQDVASFVAISAGAERFARRHPQRWLIIAGFLATAAGMILLLVLVRAHAGIWRWIPGLLLFGAGVGVMLTSSVNVVQSSFPDADQGEISGLSRSVSNLGSSLGTALVGSVLVAVKLPEGKPFAVALTTMLVIALIGLVLAVLIPRQPTQATPAPSPGMKPATSQPTP